MAYYKPESASGEADWNSRARSRIACAVLTAAAVLGIHAPARTADVESPVVKINAEAASADIVVQPLRGNISVLMGSGGNIAVLSAAGGKLMVDAGIAVSREKLGAALDRLGPGRPKYVVNTHWHWDHTDGDGWVHALGATIIAHENTLKHLSETVRVEDWSFTFKPVPPEARPTVLVQKSKTLSFEGETIAIGYYGPSHTDGDLYVYFKEADVLLTGDTWWNGYYPFIDYVAGGSIDGMIQAANINIAQATDRTIIVPGHGPVGDRSQLVEYRDMLVGIRDNVAKLKMQGKSLDESIAAKPTAAYDAKWGSFVIDPAFFTRLVYRGV
jgi:glyoxylase-like metal-dependent hydrolase (beta-lactamase superfamily II)